MSKLKVITTTIAAKILGFTPSYIRRLCISGKIKAEKHGHDWLFTEKDLKDIKRQRKEKTKEV